MSRIGLGLAHVHAMSVDARRRLIERALDLGVTHFDTARFYGDGLSERTLGAVLGSRRSSVTIATKFGLLPTPFVAAIGPAAPVARKLRSLASKLRLAPYPARSYTAAAMQSALSASLQALGTDYIDLYLIHEPINDQGLGDELFEALRRARSSGVVRLIGVSGANIDAVVSRWGDQLDVVQTAEASWRDDRYVPDITHSLFSGAVQAGGGSISRASMVEMLHRALARRPQGSVVVQTRRPDRLDEIVAAAAGT